MITGVCGLIGSALRRSMEESGFEVVGLDLRASGIEHGDVRDARFVADALRGCVGVIHLAAVSRVVYGERDPELCREVNLKGLQNILNAIEDMDAKPWLVFGSSREVYGNASNLPVDETFPLAPINVYGETKVKGEEMIAEAQKHMGLKSSVLRFSNVFGSVNDYPDRVVPAFIRAALTGVPLRVDGTKNTFDLTFLDDVVRGIKLAAIQLVSDTMSLETLHLVSGRPTTLKELAEIILDLTGSTSGWVLAPSRDYDVQQFYGSPNHAARVLGWAHSTPLEDGLNQLVKGFEREVKKIGKAALTASSARDVLPAGYVSFLI